VHTVVLGLEDCGFLRERGVAKFFLGRFEGLLFTLLFAKVLVSLEEFLLGFGGGFVHRWREP
jgi:hypothetical protein